MFDLKQNPPPHLAVNMPAICSPKLFKLSTVSSHKGYSGNMHYGRRAGEIYIQSLMYINQNDQLEIDYHDRLLVSGPFVQCTRVHGNATINKYQCTLMHFSTIAL